MNASKKTKTNFAMGLCGKNLAWMLDDGVLTIVGEGEMECGDETPWESVSNLITSVVIVDGVTTIDEFAFDGCRNLTSVTIPDGVTSIGESSFFGCTGLTSVTIGNGVTSIGWCAFYGCIDLTSVTIPDSVTSIGYYAFCDCHCLTDIYYGGTQGNWNTVKIGIANRELTNAMIHYGR